MVGGWTRSKKEGVTGDMISRGIAVLVISMALICCGCGTKEEPDGDIDEAAVYISTESVEVIAEDKEEATEEYSGQPVNAHQYARLEQLLQEIKRETE
jgi:hypothetical protein